jgi:signal transduction histidine kinase
MDTLAGALPSGTAERVLLSDMCEQATALGKDLQSISLRLHSFKLDHLGIVAAVTGFCSELSNQYGVAIGVDNDGVPEIVPKEIALALFRVLREALINAVKHSGARQIRVVLRGERTEIHLAVIDDGIGFDPEATMRREALGLVAMRERLNVVGGQLVIVSRPGAGATVRVCVPFRPTTRTQKPSD